jgi:hypothetical protein
MGEGGIVLDVNGWEVEVEVVLLAYFLKQLYALWRKAPGGDF